MHPDTPTQTSTSQRWLVGAILIGLSCSAAAIQKCTDASGKVTFSDTACPSEHKAVTQTVRKAAGSGHPVDDVVLASSSAAARGDFEALRSTAAKTDEFDKTPPGKRRDQLLALLRYAAPVDVAIASRDISPDGLSATVLATGKYRNMATEMMEPTKGKITLVRVGGSWKVLESEWGPNKW